VRGPHAASRASSDAFLKTRFEPERYRVPALRVPSVRDRRKPARTDANKLRRPVIRERSHAEPFPKKTARAVARRCADSAELGLFA